MYTCKYSAVRHINKDAAVTCRLVWMTHYRPICMGAKVTDQTTNAAQKIYKDTAMRMQKSQKNQQGCSSHIIHMDATVTNLHGYSSY